MVKEITGKHVLVTAVGAFGVIIGVNLFMASKAIGTFPGLEVKNTYVASQTFDADRAAQEALGWHAALEAAEGQLVLRLTDTETGAPVEATSVTGVLGRATSVQQDSRPDFTFDGTQYVAQTGPLGAGYWNYRLEAAAADGTVFRQRLRLYVGP